MCLAHGPQRSDAGEAQTHGPSVSSQAFYHWATVLMQMVFFKVHPACHNIVNGIKPGSNSKYTDKHAADCPKAVCWGVEWYMWDV